MSANYGEYEFNFMTKDWAADEARAKAAFDWCAEKYEWFKKDGFYLDGNSVKMDGDYTSALGDEGNEDEMKEWLTGMAEASGAEVIFGYYISDHTESANEFYWKTKFSYVDGVCSLYDPQTFWGKSEKFLEKIVEIPEGVTEIVEKEYSRHMSLLRVSIPASVTKIGKDAFSGCTLLVSAKFGGTMAQWEAVKGKLGLLGSLKAKSVMCADGEWQKPAVLLEDGVVVKCFDRGMTSAVIPEGVTTIGYGAFWGCTSLSSVVIPEGVTEIGEHAFKNCESLSSVEFGGTVAQWEAVEGKQELLKYIPASSVRCADGEWQKPVVHVENGVVVECLDRNATSVTIPEGVTAIGKSAFKWCESLTSVAIPEGVTEIGCYAFDGCKSLSSVEIPSSVTKIGWSAFEGCSSLSSVVIPSSVTEIGDGAFWSCKSLSSVVIPSSVTKIGDYAFSNCESLSSVVIPEGGTEIGKNAFSNCESLSSVVIPPSVAKIGDEAFWGCKSLASVEFGGTVAQWEAVEEKVWLLRYVPAKSVKCADGEWQKPVLLVENGVAVKCLAKDATSVTIPEGVTEIGWSAFYDCESLSSVVIPPSVKEIGDGAFQYCESLASVEFGGTKAEWKAVKKTRGWHRGVPATTVKCSNGEAKL